MKKFESCFFGLRSLSVHCWIRTSAFKEPELNVPLLKVICGMEVEAVSLDKQC